MIVAIIAGALVVLIGLFVLITYNRLVRLRLAVDNSWAQIEVALKLRHDLVPSLVETVAGYAGHESSVLVRTAEARGEATHAVGAGPAARGPWTGPPKPTLGPRSGGLTTGRPRKRGRPWSPRPAAGPASALARPMAPGPLRGGAPTAADV